MSKNDELNECNLDKYYNQKLDMNVTLNNMLLEEYYRNCTEKNIEKRNNLIQYENVHIEGEYKQALNAVNDMINKYNPLIKVLPHYYYDKKEDR